MKRLALIALVLLHAAAFAATPDDERAAKLRAIEALRAGYKLHVAGHYQKAVEQFKESALAYPTAEAYTYMGWSLSYLGKLEEAIGHCKSAIAIDPDFGNPYNDIGVYLRTLGKINESVPWFEKAIASKRYCCYHYAYTNLGLVMLAKGRIDDARRLLEKAVEIEPNYPPAQRGLELARGKRAS